MVRTLLRKVATPPHLSLRFTGQNFASQSGYATASWSKHFATQNGLLSKFCFAKPPIQNFASQSGLRPPHHGHDFRKRKLPLATAPSCAVSRSKHFAMQNGLRPPHFLRGAYFAVHKRLDLNFEQPYCQYFAI